MSQRILATILWFVAGWAGGSLLAGLTGLPAVSGVAPGVAAALLVWWDPMHRLWSVQPRTRRRIRPIEELAAELERGSGRQAPEAEQTVSR